MNQSLRVRLERLKRFATRIVFFPLIRQPSRGLREFGRRQMLRLQNSLPAEYWIDRGETVVMVGMARTKTMFRTYGAVGAQGRLIIIEAEPGNLQRLEDARKQADINNMTIVQCAAWSTDEDRELLVSPSFVGDNRVPIAGIVSDTDIRPGNETMSTITCAGRRIDAVLAELGITEVDFLLVTVNGAELEALKGAIKTIANSPKLRIYAKAHSLLEDGSTLGEEIIPFLRDKGMSAMMTRGEHTPLAEGPWRTRGGDVYAWKA